MFEPLCRVDRLDSDRIHTRTVVDLVSGFGVEATLYESDDVPPSPGRAVERALQHGHQRICVGSVESVPIEHLSGDAADGADRYDAREMISAGQRLEERVTRRP